MNTKKYFDASERRIETVEFKEGRGGVPICYIEKRVCFVHHNYSGPLPKPGEEWSVAIVGLNPAGTCYFVKPIDRVDGNSFSRAQEYGALIRSVAETPVQYQDCLAALRAGLVEPSAAALGEWLRQRTITDAKRHNNAAIRARLARALLRQYGFKILREVVLPSGEYSFITHQDYEAYWVPMREGEWLAVMTSPTRGYALSLDLAGWYSLPNADDPRPVALSQNWSPTETVRALTSVNRWDNQDY